MIKSIPNMRGARVVQVIEVRCLEGQGETSDPFREIIRFYSLDGELLATDDPYLETPETEKAYGRAGG